VKLPDDTLGRNEMGKRKNFNSVGSIFEPTELKFLRFSACVLLLGNTSILF